MAIIEINGGPITHRYLMGKTKDEIATMYMRLLRMTEQDAKDATRYRWLRDTSGGDAWDAAMRAISYDQPPGWVDASLDAAMRADQPPNIRIQRPGTGPLVAFVQAQRDALLNGTAPNTHQVTLSDEAIRRAILCDSHPADGFYIAFLNEAEMLRAGRRIAKMAAEIAASR